MPERSRKIQSTGEQRKKNPAAVALAKLGASKGGLARAKSLSKKARSRIARTAAKARWTTKVGRSDEVR